MTPNNVRELVIINANLGARGHRVPRHSLDDHVSAKRMLGSLRESESERERERESAESSLRGGDAAAGGTGAGSTEGAAEGGRKPRHGLPFTTALFCRVALIRLLYTRYRFVFLFFSFFSFFLFFPDRSTGL